MEHLINRHWLLPADLINEILSTDLSPQVQIFLSRKTIEHIQDNHPSQIPAMEKFFEAGVFSKPSFLGIERDAIDQRDVIKLVYPIFEGEKKLNIYIVACKSSLEYDRYRVITSFMIRTDNLSKKISNKSLISSEASWRSDPTLAQNAMFPLPKPASPKKQMLMALSGYLERRRTERVASDQP